MWPQMIREDICLHIYLLLLIVACRKASLYLSSINPVVLNLQAVIPKIILFELGTPQKTPITVFRPLSYIIIRQFGQCLTSMYQ